MSTISGTKEIPLTEGLLHLIILVQDYDKFQLSKRIYNKAHGKEIPQTDKETELFFYSLDKEVLNKYGLSKNISSYRKVMNYVVTPEMQATLFEDLPKHFTF